MSVVRTVFFKVMRIWARFWFEPVSPQRLAAARVVFYSTLFIQFWNSDFYLWPRLYPEFWTPIWYLAGLSVLPPHSEFVWHLAVIWKWFLFFSAIGFFTRISSLVAFLLAAYLMGIKLSAGYLSHVDNLNLVCLFIFATARSGDAFSIDQILFKRNQTKASHVANHSDRHGDYLWPIKLIWTAWAMAFFLAGASKLKFSGLHWITDGPISQSLRDNADLYTEYTLGTWRAGVGNWLSRFPFICKILAAVSISIELLAPLVLFESRIRWIVLSLCACLQMSIYVVLGMNFAHYVPVYLMFVNWSFLINKISRIRFAAFRGGTQWRDSALFALAVAVFVFGVIGLSSFANSILDRTEQAHVLSRSSIGCHSPERELGWPLNGTPGKDWVVNADVDLGSAGLPKDESGSSGSDAMTTAGHHGIDIDIPGFEAMDRHIQVLSVTGGVVADIVDGEPDRNVLKGESCDLLNAFGNMVVVKAPSGFRYTYAHLRRGSLKVHLGEQVVEGTHLGDVGSSGCSSQPHLHFEVRDCRGNVFPAIKNQAFQSAPELNPKFGVFNFVTAIGKIDRLSALIAMQGTVLSAPPRSNLSIVIATVGDGAHSSLRVSLIAPDGRERDHIDWKDETSIAHRYWYWDTRLGEDLGDWQVVIEVNHHITETLKMRVEKIQSSAASQNEHQKRQN